ncbi:hypothetical protein BGZ61DRAFT_566473 [Ilyonectria robusta]|uniref:uncharacterized protein n=1 Tax=Ilyonectria robusta TaxID=1079257 RepID=UPI001E8E6CAD|nr:uncharacterized protein BGZ61DRAFT_566473 [Ilyonectria robusta]KAH8734140.1 hypothetical protein BGZ61DRAFT_566473 [Ilyonectria robusta]
MLRWRPHHSLFKKTNRRPHQRPAPLMVSSSGRGIMDVEDATDDHTPIDLTDWAKRCCRQFLLDIMQRRTERDIRILTQPSNDLKHFIMQKMKDRDRKEGNDAPSLNRANGVHDDNPSTSPWRYARSEADSDSTSISWASVSSQTSTTSLASQMSDSFLNDVQQSVNLLLQSLREGEKRLSSIETSNILRSFLDQWRYRSSKFPDPERAAELNNAITSIRIAIEDYKDDIPSTGFPDVGLKLNACEQTFRDTVLKYLGTVKGEKELTNIRKALNRPKEWEHWHEDYPSLTSTTKGIATDVQQALQSAVEARDAYLRAAYSVIPEVIQMYAESNGCRAKYNKGGVLFLPLDA